MHIEPEITKIDDNRAEASGFARLIVPYAIGLAAPLLVALTWSPDGHWTRIEGVIRGYALPVAGAELFAIMVALREGLLRAVAQWRWPKPVIAASVVLLMVAVTSIFRAPEQSVATELTIYWLIHFLFGLSIAHLGNRIFSAADLTNAYIAGFAFFAIEFVLFVIRIPDWKTFDWKYGFMAFSHIRHAGYYLAAMAALGMGAMAIAERQSVWLFAFAAASAAFGIALWTGSRGAALAVAGSLVAGALIAPAVRSLRSLGGAVAAMLVGFAAVWIAPAAPSYLMGLIRAVQQTTNGDVTTGRTTIWLGVIAAIRKRPLLGYGEGQMHWVAPFSTMVQPHDSILQSALAWGLVGLACVTVLAITFAARAVPAVKKQQELVPVFMAMVALAILSLYDASLYYALPQSIFMACAGVIASRWSAARASPKLSAAAKPEFA